MNKTDLKRELRSLYAPSAKDFTVVDVPDLTYLMIDGEGDPNTSQSYKEAVEALFSVSYTTKFISKADLGRDYTVMPLEGLWWATDPQDFASRNKARWLWTMMIMQPDWVNAEFVEVAKNKAGQKKSLPGLEDLRLETYQEGTSVQILHLGSYDDEAPTLSRLHNEYMPANDLTFNGKHHEIYLSDPRKTLPEKLKTVLRQPVRRSGSR